MEGRVLAVCTSQKKGEQKHAVASVELVRGLGIAGDAHAGNWHRQISFLAKNKIDEMRARGLTLIDGAFGENIIVDGLDLSTLTIGRRFLLGERAVLQVTQHGKTCHTRCNIYQQAGDCIMPSHGMFARVLRSGQVKVTDRLWVDPDFDHYRLAVITLSDRGVNGERIDEAGPLAAQLLQESLGIAPHLTSILPDEAAAISQKLITLCDEEVCDLIVTTGGTGLSPRDVTPEATASVVDRQVPGIAEAIRAAGLAHTPRAMLSRGICGQRGQTLIINLSGSPRAVKEQLSAVAPVLSHALQMTTGIPADCAR